MKLIFVSSLEVHCRDAAVQRLLSEYPQALVISHDLLEGNRVLRRVEGNTNASERAESVLEHGCVGCAVRFEILPTLLRLLPQNEDAVIIQSLPATWHSDQVLDIVSTELEGRGVAIDQVALALDPAAVEDQFWDRRNSPAVRLSLAMALNPDSHRFLRSQNWSSTAAGSRARATWSIATPRPSSSVLTMSKT